MRQVGEIGHNTSPLFKEVTIYDDWKAIWA